MKKKSNLHLTKKMKDIIIHREDNWHIKKAGKGIQYHNINYMGNCYYYYGNNICMVFEIIRKRKYSSNILWTWNY